MKPGAALLTTNGAFAQLTSLGRTTPRGTQTVDVVCLRRDPQNSHQLLLGDYPLKTIPADEIRKYANIDDLGSLRAHRRAWRTVGLRLATVSSVDVDVFVPLEGVPRAAAVAVGDDDSDDEDPQSTGHADLCGYASDGGFVVADDVAFTQADADASEFVSDTHEAVQAFEDWVPSTPKGQRFRRFVASLEQKYATKDDDLQFARGTSVDYSRPPVAPKRPVKKRKRGQK